MNLILASTSPYRAELLSRLRVDFIQIDPAFAEQRIDGESPTSMCERLARGKAVAVAEQTPSAPWLIIGSDQVAHLDGEIFGKPGNFDRAFEQLSHCSGRWVTFETGLAVLSSDGVETVRSERFDIRFRALSAERITRYLNLEQPYDCAGSIRAEGLGIALIEEMRGRDFNTLLGLPMILLEDVFESMKIDFLKDIN